MIQFSHVFRVVEKDWMALKSNGEISDSACFASGWYDSLLEKVVLFLFFGIRIYKINIVILIFTISIDYTKAQLIIII